MLTDPAARPSFPEVVVRLAELLKQSKMLQEEANSGWAGLVGYLPV
jgi:hypothetical protein